MVSVVRRLGMRKTGSFKKQDGEYTYLASDIAYHRDKLQRGYDLLIDVWGADHHGYIPRMQAVMQAYGHPKERFRSCWCNSSNCCAAARK